MIRSAVYSVFFCGDIIDYEFTRPRSTMRRNVLAVTPLSKGRNP